MELNTIYDYIRMLDAEGYPRAYIDFGGYRLTFEEAELDKSGRLLEAKVQFQNKINIEKKLLWGEMNEDSFSGGSAPR